MPDCNDINNKHRINDLVNNPVISFSDSVSISFFELSVT